MDDLKSILEKILQKNRSFSDATHRNAIFRLWSQAVGEKIAKHAWPLKIIDGGLLLVGTENSSWSQHLRMLEPQLVAKIHAATGQATIKGLRFCVSTRERGVDAGV